MAKVNATAGAKQPAKRQQPDDFESVAKRLGCTMDDATFRKQLGKIARKRPEGSPKSGK